MEIDPVAGQRCARQPDGPRICPAPLLPTPTATQIANPGDYTRPGVPAHQENEVCNNYGVISTRLCLFNHNRHRALSITCNPIPRPKFRVYFLRKYISIRTIIPAQVFHVEHCTYNHGHPISEETTKTCFQRNGAGRRRTGPDERLSLLRKT